MVTTLRLLAVAAALAQAGLLLFARIRATSRPRAAARGSVPASLFLVALVAAAIALAFRARVRDPAWDPFRDLGLLLLFGAVLPPMAGRVASLLLRRPAHDAPAPATAPVREHWAAYAIAIAGGAAAVGWTT
ncbi:hypothetical protein ACN20G_16080 [Streptomyces sp. BI20]|uniref:hypothetical protein n=1 Tax=Streptomyces sp. BI20 TaxID=3403460 RepID=UPI003C771A2E